FLSPKAGSHLAPIPPVYFIIAGHRGLCWRSHWRTVLTGIAATTILFTCTSAFAQTLTGTVTNGTTKKPASDDDVVLIKLGQGMEEAARTKTDPNGNFTFKLDDSGPHLVRAIHQGVTYHKMAPPGTTSADLEVFDVSKKLAGISVTADVMRFQAQGNELQGIRLFAVDNHSDPPRTQMNDQNFEFYLPDGAEVDQSMAMTAGGQPINSAPVPQREKNRYAFVFPLRPGETQFQVAFHMPYSGQLSVDPKALYGAQHFVVMLPKSMQFSAALVWCWLQERFTLPSGRARRPWMLFIRNPSRFQQRRLRQAGPACSSKRLKTRFSNSKSNINKAASHKKSTKNPKRRWIRRLSVH